MIEFAALVHEIEGRLASIAIYVSQTRAASDRLEPEWLDRRLERIYGVACEVQRITESVKQLWMNSSPNRERFYLSALASRCLEGWSIGRHDLAAQRCTSNQISK